MFQLILYKIAYFISMYTPRKTAYAVARFFSLLQYYVSKKDRQTVHGNLSSIFPEKDEKEISRMAKLVFINFGKYLADFFSFEKLDTAFLEHNVVIEGRENLDSALKKGKGVIIISAHLGNWELGGAIAGNLGYDVMAVVLRHSHEKVDQFFNRQRRIAKMSTCTLEKAVHCSLIALKEKRIIALVADRSFSNSGAAIPFLNKTSIIPKGAAAFHLKTGAPIVPVFCVRNPDDTFLFKLHEPIELKKPVSDRENDIEQIIKAYISIIESYIRKFPDQWYMFRKYWTNNESLRDNSLV